MGEDTGATLILVIIKTCLAGLVVVAVATLGLAARSGTVLAHDCNNPWHMSSSGSDSHHDGGHDTCPILQPAPTGAGKPVYTPAPAQMGGVAPALQLEPTPSGQAAVLAPQAPAPRRPEAAGIAPGEGSRVAASSGGSGVSGLALALVAVAVITLVMLIRAGFRARRRLGDGVDARWPEA